MNDIRRRFTSIGLAATLCASVLSVQGSLFAGAKERPSAQERERKVKNLKTKRGAEVAQRVDQLKRFNREVRNALKAFEKNERRNGRRPKIEDSWMHSGAVTSSEQARNVTCRGCPPLKKVSFNPQDPPSEDGIELIFIPTYSVEGEWQGTVIFHRLDSAGNFLDQYVADVVMTRDPNEAKWDVIYEVSYEGGAAYLESDPALGMITDPNFELGTPLDQQPGDLGPRTDPFAGYGVSLQRLAFTPPNMVEPQRLPGPGPRYPPNPKMNAFMKCTGITCAAVLGGCGLASLIFSPAVFGPCTVAGCAGGAIRCGLTAIFG